MLNFSQASRITTELLEHFGHFIMQRVAGVYNFIDRVNSKPRPQGIGELPRDQHVMPVIGLASRTFMYSALNQTLPLLHVQ